MIILVDTTSHKKYYFHEVLLLLLLLLLGVDVYRLGMSLSRPLAAPSTTVLSLAMSLATARHAAT